MPKLHIQFAENAVNMDTHDDTILDPAVYLPNDGKRLFATIASVHTSDGKVVWMIESPFASTLIQYAINALDDTDIVALHITD